MPQGYIDKAGAYYESDGEFADLKVPRRPSEDHAWDGAAWQLSTAMRDARLAAEKDAQIAEAQRPLMRALIAELAARFGETPVQFAQKIKARL